RPALLNELRRRVMGGDLLSLVLTLSVRESEALADYRHAFPDAVVEERICQTTELPAQDSSLPADLEMRFRARNRRPVRKALNQGFEEWVVADDDEEADSAWRFLYDVHLENMAAIGGRPKRPEHLHALRRQLPAHRRRLSMAMLNREPVSALLVLPFQSTTEYI